MEVFHVWDNKGYTADRYTLTVYYEETFFIVTSSDSPTHPQGVWSVEEDICLLPEDIEDDNKHTGEEIDYFELPIAVRETVEYFFKEEV